MCGITPRTHSRVRSGDLTLRDIGTVFDVTRAGKRLDVAVAEGSVMFQPDHDAITLGAGKRLSANEGIWAASRWAPSNPTNVGGWRDGRIAFAGDPLSSVFAAIDRRYGVTVKLGGGLVRPTLYRHGRTDGGGGSRHTASGRIDRGDVAA